MDIKNFCIAIFLFFVAPFFIGGFEGLVIEKIKVKLIFL